MDLNSKAYIYIEKTFGNDIALKYKEFTDITPIDYIRINPLKTNFYELKNILSSKYEIEIEAISQIQFAAKVLLDKNLLIGKTLEHTLGYYYIQSISSMLPAFILNPQTNERVLDLCAAPGSKTTHLAEMMNNKGTLIANEIDLNRVKALVFNIDRLNIINVGVINYKGELLSKVYDNYFDKILVDAPCSSLGIIQKKGEVTKWWSIEHSERLYHIQLKLLISAIKMLKAGGEIVYSTCTLTVEENEMVLEKVLKNYPVELKEIQIPFQTRKGQTKFLDEELNSQISLTHRILPWEINSDGFFIAKLFKYDITQPLEKSSFRKSDLSLIDYKNKTLAKSLMELSDYFGFDYEVFSEYKFLIKGTDIFILNKYWFDNNLSLFNRIGTNFGTLDSFNRITLHSNAGQLLSNYISKKIVELNDIDQLDDYISGGKIETPELENGQYLIKYNGYTLGTAIKSKEGLKSRFPKNKRTQKIEFR